MVYIKIILINLMIMGTISIGAADAVQAGPYIATFDLSGEYHPYELPANHISTNDGVGYTNYIAKIGEDNILTIEFISYNKPMDTSLQKEVGLLSNVLMEAHHAQGTHKFLSIDGHYGILIDAIDGAHRDVYGAAYWLDPYTWVIITSYHPWYITDRILKSFHASLPTSEPKIAQCPVGCDFTPGKCRYIGNHRVCDGGSCSCGNLGFGQLGSIGMT